MRVLKKSFMSVCVALALVLMLPSMNVYAASTYTVTFRPGNVGYFALADTTLTEKKAMAEEAAAAQYSEGTYHVTDMGAIKVTVTNGSTLDAPRYIRTEAGYFAKSESEWGPNGETIKKNTDYVVDYGKLVNGVEYTVEYVDIDSGDSIAPVKIAQANVGDEINEAAPEQIVISGGAIYKLEESHPMPQILKATPEENVYTFKYRMLPAGTIIEEVTIEGEGGTIVTTETVTTTIDNGTTVVGGGVAAGGGVGGGAGAGGAAEGGAEAGGNEAVEILDEETPLAGGISEETEEPAGMVEIGEEDVPLSSGEEPMANMALIGASVFGAGAVVLAGLWLYMKKKRVTAEVNNQKE